MKLMCILKIAVKYVCLDLCMLENSITPPAKCSYVQCCWTVWTVRQPYRAAIFLLCYSCKIYLCFNIYLYMPPIELCCFLCLEYVKLFHSAYMIKKIACRESKLRMQKKKTSNLIWLIRICIQISVELDLIYCTHVIKTWTILYLGLYIQKYIVPWEYRFFSCPPKCTLCLFYMPFNNLPAVFSTSWQLLF